MEMTEEVSSGGLHKFRYEKGAGSKLSVEKKKEIEGAYGQYYERKALEKRNRIIFWIIGILVGLGALGLIVWRIFV